LLTIGDGLVTQIPALLVSTAAGIIVTRSASENSLGQDISRQLLMRPRAVAMTAAFMGIFMLVPGMPKAAFGTLMVVTALIAWVLHRTSIKGPETVPAGTAAGVGAGVSPVAPAGRGGVSEVESMLKVEPLELELGATLIPLVEPGSGGDLLARIAQIRKRMAGEAGMVLPPVRVKDNLQLTARRYRLLLRGAPIGDGELHLDRLLAINPGSARSGLEGATTVDPAFGLPAMWIAPAQRGRAEAYGYTVVEPPAVLSTHLHELLRSYASELLTRQDVQDMVDRLREASPAIVKDVVPNVVSLPVLHRVLQGLLRERVPIRDLAVILETLADHAGTGKNVEALVEAARISLSSQFVRGLTDAQNRLGAVVLDPALETRLVQSIVPTDTGPALVLPPVQVPRILQAIEENHARSERRRRNVVLVCSATLRPHLRRLLDRSLPKTPILSYMEIPRGVQLDILSQVPATAWAEMGGVSLTAAGVGEAQSGTRPGTPATGRNSR
jgi:flagellar biosynthesis protein FlhA